MVGFGEIPDQAGGGNIGAGGADDRYRQVLQATRPSVAAERRDGRFEPVEHTTRRAVSYSFGGTPPLTLAEMFKANLEEFELAIAALTTHQGLIEEILPKLKNEDSPGAGRT